ncbi:hypothetical protein Fot_28158 [Forsythia ovata]|uniref:Uncharacterized protein n=1 Tax=Forsythia ovata TaxID=205694 RepID=A0ABD1TN72_9LAMI
MDSNFMIILSRHKASGRPVHLFNQKAMTLPTPQILPHHFLQVGNFFHTFLSSSPASKFQLKNPVRANSNAVAGSRPINVVPSKCIKKIPFPFRSISDIRRIQQFNEI